MKVLITGASRGIGRELVHYFASLKNYEVLALARDRRTLETLQSECTTQYGCVIQICEQDLAADDYSKLKTSLGAWDHVDIVIANAGFLINKLFMETGMADWAQVFNANLFSNVKLLQVLHPYLSASSIAHVVTIGSMGGVQGSKKFPGLAAYSAAKGALAVLTECLAEEWKKDQIKVNCLCLGAVNTEMLNAAFPGYQAPVSAEQMAQFIGNFSCNAYKVMSGRIIQVALSDPD